MIHLRHVKKSYYSGKTEVCVNNNISLDIKTGEFALLVGESGAGKSTLLNIISGLETCDAGLVKIANKDISQLKDRELSLFRKQHIGFVFQFYNLIGNLTVKENVELIARMKKKSYDVEKILQLVGLSKKMNHFPAQLSGGEQQRVSIARAIVKRPKILLCDEPTGALDHKTGKSILRLLQNLSSKRKMTVVMVTHNRSLIPMANRVFEVSDGKIIKRIATTAPTAVDALHW